METDLPDPQMVACARQIMDVPMDFASEEDALLQDTPHYIGWFALAHVVVLLYLALHWLQVGTPIERTMVAITIAVLGVTCAWIIRGKMRDAVAMAEIVAPTEVAAKAAE